MRLSLLSLAAAAALASAMPASAHIQVFVGTLSGANEAPANASTGTGQAWLTIDDHDNTILVKFDYTGLLGNATAAHIHCCTAVANAATSGVATPTPTFPGMVLGAKSGSYEQLFDMNQASSWNAAFLNASPRNGDTTLAFSTLITAIADGHAYLNIHSAAVGAGEIRTFFTAAPVPEPGSYALMLGGLGVLGWAARRRRAAA